MKHLTGNTVRIETTFKDFNRENKDPDIVKFIIYDSEYTKISEVVLDESNRLDTGVYFYDYQIPNENYKTYYYEFNGEFGGKHSLNRDTFEAAFMI